MNSKHTVLIFYFLILTVRGLSDEEEWRKFKATYKRTYDAEEDRFRFEIFQQNLLEILEHNEKFEEGTTTCRLGINKFADLSHKELGISPYQDDNLEALNYDEHDCYTTNQVIPDEFDWRTLDAMTEVKDQRDYYEGYSWAFAVVAALETQVYLAIRTLVPLSAQQLIDCIVPPLVFWGDFMDYVYVYVMKMGILTEDEYPYTNSAGDCRQNETGIYVNMLTDLGGECGIKESVYIYGPVTTIIDASRLYNYESGIVDGTMCSNDETILNHTVLIVGFGNDSGTEYWIARNSWGSDWGEDGYFRIARLANNTCGVGSHASFPYIDRDKFIVT